MIEYMNTLDNITPDNLDGFFVGWPNPPSATKHYELLEKSAYIWLAVDNETKNVEIHNRNFGRSTRSIYSFAGSIA